MLMLHCLECCSLAATECNSENWLPLQFFYVLPRTFNFKVEIILYGPGMENVLGLDRCHFCRLLSLCQPSSLALAPHWALNFTFYTALCAGQCGKHFIQCCECCVLWMVSGVLYYALCTVQRILCCAQSVESSGTTCSVQFACSAKAKVGTEWHG